MKRTCMIVVASLMLASPMFAQKQMDQASEKSVHITQGPNITNITPNAATINWTTNSPGANHVRYRVAGSNGAWKSAYHSGGGTSHSLQLAGLEPGKNYEWQILTRDGDLRTAGQFATPTSGTAPDVNASATTPAPSTPAPGSTTGAGTAVAKTPLYRAVSTSNAGHLYTTNAGEQSSQNFKPEGITGYVATSQVDGTQPLYRLSNAKSDYILTTDPNFRASMMGQGYQDGGVVGYVASQQLPGTQPLYQLSSADGASHFYTTNAGERDQVIARGWKDQGQSGFIWAQP